MGVYGEQIARLKLVREIAKSKGRDDLSESDVVQLHAMVLNVADQVGDLLAAIPMTFKQYTKHDLLHARNLIDLMGRFIPAKTLKKLNGVELTVLALVAMLHDFGMYVQAEEKQRIVDGEEFRRLLDAIPEKKQAISDAEEAGRPYVASAIRDAVLADYFRKLHPERARLNIEEYLPGILRFREHDLTDDIATICESHGWGVFETNDPRHPERTIERLKTSDPIYGVPFNPQYVAACLRLADIMDFDRSRTPLALLRTVTDVKSLSEWKKHLQIRGWTITDRDVSFHAKCTHPEHYVAVMEFLDWIDVELRDCRRLIRKQPEQLSQRYLLNLPTNVDRFEVEMSDASYIAGAFRFELDYERIMKILMDQSLYPDPSLFLRELLQNSLDACRVRRAMAQSEDAANSYSPRITIWDLSADTADPRIVFQDNGIGMSRSVIEKYFMRVGRSYYRSTEFEIERKRLRDKGIDLEATSQFGIGFLSCFMVADRIEIDTYNDRSEPLHVVIEGPTKYFTIQMIWPPDRPHFRLQGVTREEDGPPIFCGTRVVTYLRPGVSIRVNEVLDRLAANLEFGVEVVSPTEEVQIKPWRWRLAEVTSNEKREAFQTYSEEPNVITAMAALVTPLFVPIETYDFCEGLHGKLWFWMLRGDDGRPVPQKGNLRIGGSIHVIGAPALASSIKSLLLNVPDLLHDDGIHEPSLGTHLPDRASISKLVSAFNKWWVSAPRDQPVRVTKWFGDPFIDKEWYSADELPTILANADSEWTDYPLVFDNAGVSVYGPERLALFGIDLPAGITVWDPMSGYGNRIRLPMGAACRIDVRSRVPKPAASRLFVDAAEGSRIGIPLQRALLRFGLQQVQEHRDDLWYDWFDEILLEISYDLDDNYWPQVLPMERDLIRDVLGGKVQVYDGDDVHEHTLEELRNRWGQWAPIRSHGVVRTTVGLWPSGRNRFILFGHPIRSNGDTKEVDIDNYVGEPFEWN